MKIKPLKGDYVVNIQNGKLYKKMSGINPRWSPHVRNKRVTTFFALLDVYDELDDTKNITPKQIQKSIQGITKSNRFKMFESFDLARLTEARIYLVLTPTGRYNNRYRSIADEIISRVGKHNPELVI